MTLIFQFIFYLTQISYRAPASIQDQQWMDNAKCQILND